MRKFFQVGGCVIVALVIGEMCHASTIEKALLAAGISMIVSGITWDDD